MRRFAAVYLLSLLTALCGLAAWGCFGLCGHAIAAVDKLGDAGAGLAQTAGKLNGKHGTIAMLDEDVGAGKSLIVHADLVARHEQQQLTVWDARGSELFANLNGGVSDLRATIRAAGKTADAATGTLNAAQSTVSAAKPVLEDTDATIRKIEAMTPDIARAAKGTADTAEQTAATATDARKVADHIEQAIDNPAKRPWYIKILPKTMQVAVQALLERWAMH